MYLQSGTSLDLNLSSIVKIAANAGSKKVYRGHSLPFHGTASAEQDEN